MERGARRASGERLSVGTEHRAKRRPSSKGSPELKPQVNRSVGSTGSSDAARLQELPARIGTMGIPAPRPRGDGQDLTVADDFNRIREALERGGVNGIDDFGRFVNDSTYLEASRFDERSAFPILLGLFPTLTDPKAVEATARYLGRPIGRPASFKELLAAFRRWGPAGTSVGWVLGDSLASTATEDELPVMLELAQDRSFGVSRQMIVYSLWRYKKDKRVSTVLVPLMRDPDVCLQAMSALRRTVGNDNAIPLLKNVRDGVRDPKIKDHAVKAIRVAERATRKAKSQRS